MAPAPPSLGPAMNAQPPKAGDLVHVTRAASVQFLKPILLRIIRVLDDWTRNTYDGWCWLDGYELDAKGDAVARRSIFVQPAELQTPRFAPTPAGRWSRLPSRACVKVAVPPGVPATPQHRGERRRLLTTSDALHPGSTEIISASGTRTRDRGITRSSRPVHRPPAKHLSPLPRCPPTSCGLNANLDEQPADAG